MILISKTRCEERGERFYNLTDVGDGHCSSRKSIIVTPRVYVAWYICRRISISRCVDHEICVFWPKHGNVCAMTIRIARHLRAIRYIANGSYRVGVHTPQRWTFIHENILNSYRKIAFNLYTRSKYKVSSLTGSSETYLLLSIVLRNVWKKCIHAKSIVYWNNCFLEIKRCFLQIS